MQPFFVCVLTPTLVCCLQVLFKAPPDAVLEWDSNAISGVHRWLKRVWTNVHQARAEQERVNAGGVRAGDAAAVAASDSDAEVELAMHVAIRQISAAYGEKHSFNTAVSDLMKFSNVLRAVPTDERGSATYLDAMRTFLVLLAPAAPHIASDLWDSLAGLPASQTFGWDLQAPVLAQPWPDADAAVLVQDELQVAVQINGKFRGSIPLPQALLAAGDPGALAAAVSRSSLGKWLPDVGQIVRTIVPKGKPMVGFVLSTGGKEKRKKKKK